MAGMGGAARSATVAAWQETIYLRTKGMTRMMRAVQRAEAVRTASCRSEACIGLMVGLFPTLSLAAPQIAAHFVLMRD